MSLSKKILLLSLSLGVFIAASGWGLARMAYACVWIVTDVGSGCADNMDLYKGGGNVYVDQSTLGNSNAIASLLKALNGDPYKPGIKVPRSLIDQLPQNIKDQVTAAGGDLGNVAVVLASKNIPTDTSMCAGLGDQELRDCLAANYGVYVSPGELFTLCAGKIDQELIQCAKDNGYTINICTGAQRTSGGPGNHEGEFVDACVNGVDNGSPNGCGQIDFCKDNDCSRNYIIDKSNCGVSGGGDTTGVKKVKTPPAACTYVKMYSKLPDGTYVASTAAQLAASAKAGDVIRFAVKANSTKYSLAKFDITVGGKTTTLQVDANKGKVDDKDARIKYSGTWSVYDGTDYGYYKDSTHFTNKKNATMTMSFTDTGVSIYRTLASNRGQMKVFIDNKLVDTLDNYATSSAVQQKKTYSGLAATDNKGKPKVHTLKLVATGTKNSSSTDSYVDVDAIEIGDGLTAAVNSDGEIFTDYTIPSAGSFSVVGSIQ